MPTGEGAIGITCVGARLVDGRIEVEVALREEVQEQWSRLWLSNGVKAGCHCYGPPSKNKIVTVVNVVSIGIEPNVIEPKGQS
jgi:hypothetical protein